jgi:hypothetical protein
MNLNDRVALLLGRAIIRAEEMAIRAELAEAKVAELTSPKSPRREAK